MKELLIGYGTADLSQKAVSLTRALALALTLTQPQL